MMMRRGGRWLVVLVAGLLSLPVYADYAAAMQALKDKDYTKGLALMQASAAAKDRDAMLGLAMMYWNGMGVPRDQEKALGWARKSAAAGNPLAMNLLANVSMKGQGVPQDFLAARAWAVKSAAAGNAAGRVLFFMTVADGPELNYRVAGKPDMARYNALAKRSVEQRALEQKAYDELAKAVADGDDTGKVLAVATLVDKVGPGNRERALTMLQGMGTLPPQLENAKNAMSGLAGIGDSYTNVSTFMNAKTSALVSAGLLGTQKGFIAKGVCSADDLKITKTAISRPLDHAVYLPVTEALLKNVYLISGDWQETWTFDACGKPVVVPLEFQADGMGGAYFQSTVKPKAS